MLFMKYFLLSLLYQKNDALMQTMTLTLPDAAGTLHYFTIQFNILNFDAVCEAVAELKNIDELTKCALWRVIL